MPPWSSEHILCTISTSGRPPVGPPVGDGQHLALGSPPGKPPGDGQSTGDGETTGNVDRGGAGDWEC